MLSQPEHKIVKEKTLRNFCTEILMRAKVPQKEAEIVVDSLVSTDLRGVNTHGVINLPRYISLIESGAARPCARIEVIQDLYSTALWDGCGSLGQILGVRAMEKCLDKAERYGISVIGVKRSNHFGAAAYYAMKGLERDMIGIALTSGGPVMAPWGGCTQLLSNNPIAVAIPCGKELPIVLDISMSVVAGMKLKLLKKEGKTKIPRGWAMDKEGRVTEDIEEAMEAGPLLVPMGGHKGSGLALVNGILSGILLGAGYGFSASDGEEGPGHLFAAIRIDTFRPVEEFKESIDKRVRELKNSKLAEGFERILIPGEIEFEMENKTKKEGISIPHKIIDDLNQLAESLDIQDRL